MQGRGIGTRRVMQPGRSDSLSSDPLTAGLEFLGVPFPAEVSSTSETTRKIIIHPSQGPSETNHLCHVYAILWFGAM